MVVCSSSTPSVALLVRPSGTVYSIVDCHEFTESGTDIMPVKVDLVICSFPAQLVSHSQAPTDTQGLIASSISAHAVGV